MRREPRTAGTIGPLSWYRFSIRLSKRFDAVPTASPILCLLENPCPRSSLVKGSLLVFFFGRGGSTNSLVASALGMTIAVIPLSAACSEVDINLSQTPKVVGQRVAGPTKLVFAGINPFRYDWSAAVNQIVVAAPALPFATNDSGAPAPAPAAAAGKAPATTGVSNSALIAKTQLNFTVQAPHDDCDPPAKGRLADCVNTAASDVMTIKQMIDSDVKGLNAVQSGWNALVLITDNVLESADVSTQKGRDDLRSAIETKILTKDPNPLEATAPNLSDLIAQIPAWPADLIETSRAKFDRLSGAFGNPPDSKLSAAHEIVTQEIAYLKQVDPTSVARKTYEAAVADLQQRRVSRLVGISYGRFVFEQDEPCGGLGAGGAEKTVTVSLDDHLVSDVTVVCDPRLVVSSGVAFSRLEQRTFGSIPQNTAQATAPAAGASPLPATIVEQNFSAVRPIAIAFANVRLFDGPTAIRNVYGSFGFTLNSNSNYSNIDYAGGISYAVGKTLFLTGGYHLGYEDFPAPGYNPGQFIANGSNPQTLQRRRTAPFFGVSFGK